MDAAKSEGLKRLIAVPVVSAVILICFAIFFRKKKEPTAEQEAEVPATVRAEPEKEEPRRTSLPRNIFSILLILVAAAALVVSLGICRYALDSKPVILSGGGDPAERAEQFMDAVFHGRSSEAEAMLLGGGSLGLGEEPADAVAKMLYNALQESFSFDALGQMEQDGVEASQSFTVTYLNIPALTEGQNALATARLAELLEQAERREDVVQADGSYKTEVAMAVLEEITAKLIESAETHYVTTELTLRLQYSGGSWYVIADQGLFAILSGDTAY